MIIVVRLGCSLFRSAFLLAASIGLHQPAESIALLVALLKVKHNTFETSAEKPARPFFMKAACFAPQAGLSKHQITVLLGLFRFVSRPPIKPRQRHFAT